MHLYREVSLKIRAIFADYTALIEPLSLDEAYLDVTDSPNCHGSATLIAEDIRRRVEQELGITVSAGVAPNKFLAKIASDWNKPRSEEHTSELQSRPHLVCRLLLEKKK